MTKIRTHKLLYLGQRNVGHNEKGESGVKIEKKGMTSRREMRKM